jgi:hypothetical protein
MYITAMVIFIAGVICGTAWGIAHTDSVLHIAMATVVGGFIGSAAGAVCFAVSYLFLSKEETDGSDEPVEKNTLSVHGNDSAGQLPDVSNKRRIKKMEKELNQLKKKKKRAS